MLHLLVKVLSRIYLPVDDPDKKNHGEGVLGITLFVPSNYPHESKYLHGTFQLIKVICPP